MPESQYRAREVNAKTQEVLDYHRDESLPGKPLHILIPGGLVALASLGVIILVAYKTAIDKNSLITIYFGSNCLASRKPCVILKADIFCPEIISL